MKKYHITGMEVKTIYHISLTPMNMEDILAEVLKGDWSLMAAMEAFTGYGMNTLEPTRATCEKLMAELWSPAADRAATKTVYYIAHEILGFDGVENYGYYSPITQEVRMVCYNRGDHANA